MKRWVSSPLPHKLGFGVYSCSPSVGAVERGESEVQGQPGLSKTLSQEEEITPFIMIIPFSSDTTPDKAIIS